MCTLFSVVVNFRVQMCDWLESEFLDEQMKSIKEMAEYVTNLRRVGPGLGQYMFNKESLGD